MRSLVLIFLCFVSTWASPRGSRILGGEEARVGQFPWTAALRIARGATTWSCGGAIISRYYVVTSAYCVQNVTNVTITTGTISTSSSPAVTAHADSIRLHEGFSANTMRNDLAVLLLDRQLNFDNYTQAIALGTDELAGNEEITVEGWGGGVLHYTNVTTWDNDDCLELYGDEYIFDSTLCASFEGRPARGPCTGDSGSPAIIDVEGTPTLVAIVSFVSDGGCDSGDPSGYTRISYYKQWLKDRTGVGF